MLSREIEEVLNDATAICCHPAPTGREGARATFVASLLEDARWNTIIDDVGNVVARYNATSRAPVLMVAAHLDTVHEQEEIDVGRVGTILSGPGIGDNSLGVAGLVHLARTLPAVARETVALVATVGEEGLGNLRGARAAVAELEPAEFVALEGGGIDDIIVRGVGSIRFRVHVHGPGGHSWEARHVPSALHGLLWAIGHVEKVGYFDGAESFNVGRISGGTSVSTRAEDADAVIEWRSCSTGALAKLERRVEGLVKALHRVTEFDGLEPAVEILGARPGGFTPEDAAIVSDAQEARGTAGLTPAEFRSASTDANAGMAVGIPAICVGLAENSGAHTKHEAVDVARLTEGLQAVRTLIECRAKSRPLSPQVHTYAQQPGS